MNGGIRCPLLEADDNPQQKTLILMFQNICPAAQCVPPTVVIKAVGLDFACIMDEGWERPASGTKQVWQHPVSKMKQVGAVGLYYLAESTNQL